MDWLDRIIEGYVAVEQVRHGQVYPEQNQPQVEAPVTPASSAALEQRQSFLGLSERQVWIGGSALFAVTIALILRK